MTIAKKTTAVLLGGLFAASAFAGGASVSSADGTTVMGAAPSQSQHWYPHASATETSNVPMRAGEASTMTNGVPNAVTYNPNPDEGRYVVELPREIQRVPQQAGEATTMVGGNPNANPDDPILYRR